ncbi:hypothetical protein [Sphingorhabdus sp. Alg239-R122]|uniref:hypothetical protein n=1 Tax=Sphingorhabdus sp. Alg239-R122 TaxID=2305989 RepID=UPI0013DC039E|nr:hypothetical protein [Sphingorhabdus sp. Alg239-R122]
MKRHSRGKLAIFGLLLALAGMLAGFFISSAMVGDVRGNMQASQPTSPTEKYSLGQNASDTPATRQEPVKLEKYVPKTSAVPDVRYKNGARVLVPGEPALKEVRSTLEDGYDYTADPESESTDPGGFGDVKDGYFLDGGVKETGGPEADIAAAPGND